MTSKVEKLHGQLSWGPYTNDETGQMKWGCCLMLVGFDTEKEAELFCDKVSAVSNKEFGTDIQQDEQVLKRRQEETGGVH